MRFVELKELTVLTSTHTVHIHADILPRQLNNMVKMAEDRELYLGLNAEHWNTQRHSIPHNAMAFWELFERYCTSLWHTNDRKKKRKKKREKKQNGNKMKYRRKIYCDWLCVHCVYSVRSSSHKVFKLRLSGFSLAFSLFLLWVSYRMSLSPHILPVFSAPSLSRALSLSLSFYCWQPYRGTMQYIFILYHQCIVWVLRFELIWMQNNSIPSNIL